MTEFLVCAGIVTFVIAWIIRSVLRDKSVSRGAQLAVVSAGLVFVLGLWGLLAWIWHDILEFAKPM
jgi:hypothetical protein